MKPRGAANSAKKTRMKQMHVTSSSSEAPALPKEGDQGGHGDIEGAQGWAQEPGDGVGGTRTSRDIAPCPPRLCLGDPRWFNLQLFPLFPSPGFLDNR